MKEILTIIKEYVAEDRQNMAMVILSLIAIIGGSIAFLIKHSSPHDGNIQIKDNYQAVNNEDFLDSWGKRSFEEKEKPSPLLPPPPVVEPKATYKISDKFKHSELIRAVDAEEEERKRKVRIALRMYNENKPFTTFMDKKSFLEQYKDQPTQELINQREEPLQTRDIGNTSALCRYGEVCERSIKPTRLNYLLRVGTSIPTQLNHNINSQIQSNTIELQTTRDVVAFHGNNILIPRNSIVTCENVPVEEPLQTRLEITCRRILTPNGVLIKIDGKTADASGSEGVQGITDFRLAEQFKRTAIASLVPIATNLSIDANSQAQANAAQDVSQIWTTQATSLLNTTIDTKPIIYIEAGTEILVKTQNDIVFYEPRDGIFIPTWQTKGVEKE